MVNKTVGLIPAARKPLRHGDNETKTDFMCVLYLFDSFGVFHGSIRIGLTVALSPDIGALG